MAINTVPRRCACKRWIYEFWWWFQKQKRANEPVNETKQNEKKKINSTNWDQHIRKKNYILLNYIVAVSFIFPYQTRKCIRARIEIWFRFHSNAFSLWSHRWLHASISLEFVSHRLLFGATKSTTTTCAAMHCNMTCHSVLENMPVYLPYDLYAVLFNMKKYVLLHHSLMAINACIRS